MNLIFDQLLNSPKTIRNPLDHRLIGLTTYILWYKIQKVWKSSRSCIANTCETSPVLLATLTIQHCNVNVLHNSTQSRCLSVLDFWNVNLGVYYKLEKKNRFQIKLDFFFSSSNLIFTACVACKNQFRNQIDFLIS